MRALAATTVFALLACACGSTKFVDAAPADASFDGSFDASGDARSSDAGVSAADAASVGVGVFTCEPFESECIAGQETCCYAESVANRCVPREKACDPGFLPIECGSNANCGPGSVCCVDGAAGSFRGARCTAPGACTGTGAPACTGPADCPAPRTCSLVTIVSACR